MSYEIDWHDNFYGISWAYEKDRLVVSTVFEDKSEANTIAQEIEEWSDKFTRLTIVKKKMVNFPFAVMKILKFLKVLNILGYLELE